MDSSNTNTNSNSTIDTEIDKFSGDIPRIQDKDIKQKKRKEEGCKEI